jgi:hypothetical protein
VPLRWNYIEITVYEKKYRKVLMRVAGDYLTESVHEDGWSEIRE